MNSGASFDDRAKSRFHFRYSQRSPAVSEAVRQFWHPRRLGADLGAAMFFTDYSMTPVELGQALEARGFESVWAPEHSHIPST